MGEEKAYIMWISLLSDVKVCWNKASDFLLLNLRLAVFDRWRSVQPALIIDMPNPCERRMCIRIPLLSVYEESSDQHMPTVAVGNLERVISTRWPTLYCSISTKQVCRWQITCNSNECNRCSFKSTEAMSKLISRSLLSFVMFLMSSINLINLSWRRI